MKIISLLFLFLFVLQLFGCRLNRDKIDLLDTKNKKLSLQIESECQISQQRREQAYQQQEQVSIRQRQHSAQIPSEDFSKSIPGDDFTIAAIDDGFKRWSSAWMMDRYVPGSAKVTDKGFKDATYVIRGLFDFFRGGTQISIPYSASFTNSSDGYRLSNLCYNDNTSGSTDCIDHTNALAIKSSSVESTQYSDSSLPREKNLVSNSQPNQAISPNNSNFNSIYLDRIIENCNQINSDNNNPFTCEIYKEGDTQVIDYVWATVQNTDMFGQVDQMVSGTDFLREVLNKKVIKPFCEYHVHHGNNAIIKVNGMRSHTCIKELRMDKQLGE